MLNINGKKLCESCFAELGDYSGICPFCGGKGREAEFVTALRNGVVLAGRYVVGSVLGKGGFGVTYLCYDTKSNKKVAIKEYFPDAVAHRNSGDTLVSTQMGSGDISFKTGAQKFYDEAKLVSRFNGNPNIIAVHEFFFENNTAYFVMEYLDGIDLKHYMKSKGGKLPENEALYVLDKISEALVIVHSMGVLHRDISPDNIFLTEDGNVKLIDFGAARQVMGEASKSLSVILKQGFAPLEQYQKKGNQGPWTDIYALGATIYYSITGRIIDDAMSRIDNDALDGSDISPELFAVLQKMLSVRAENRYQSIVELKRDLSSLVASATPPQLAKSRKNRFCPKCGKEIPGNQILCNECSGTSASANPINYGASATPVNYGTSAKTASYGTPVYTAAQNIAPKVVENKQSKSKLPYIIAACISAIALAVGTIAGVVLMSSKSKPKNEENPTTTVVRKNDEVEKNDIIIPKEVEYKDDDDGGKRSPEDVATAYMEATKNCDAEKIVALMPEKLVDWVVKKQYNGDRRELMKTLQEILDTGKDSIEEKGGKMSKIEYEIVDVKDVDEDEIDETNEALNGEGVDIWIKDAKTVEIEMSYPSQDKIETLEVIVVKIGNSWYLLS